MQFGNARGLFFSLIVVALFATSHIALAEIGAGITVVPASIEEGADPGSIISKTLKVTNDSDADKEYFIYKKNIKGVETGGVPVFAKDETEKTGYEISDWISIPTEPLKVPAGSMVDLPIIISVPTSATPGSHFGGIFVSLEPPKMRELGAGVGYEVASIVSIRISGDIIDTARIRSFSTDKLLYGNKNVNFTAKIENQGNILIRPRGPVTITSMFGKKAGATFTVNDSLAGVFPGTMRDIEFNWDEDGFGFGRYEAVLALAYDGANGQKTIDASLIFWVFPIKIMLGILAGLVALVVIGYAFTKYYVNQAIVRAAGSRRIISQRQRKQVGISRFTFVSVTLMIVLVLFLLVLLVFSA
jgi:hypothetical protein